jgi:hypothetical protein
LDQSKLAPRASAVKNRLAVGGQPVKVASGWATSTMYVESI